MSETDSVSLRLQLSSEWPWQHSHMEWQVGHALQWNKVCPHPNLPQLDPVPTYTINHPRVSSTNHHKDLGVIMTSNLSWSRHHHLIITRAYRSLGLIRRSFSTTIPPTPNSSFLYLLSDHSWPTALPFGDPIYWKTSSYLREFKNVPRSIS